MVMLCSDVFPKGVDTPQFGFPRHRNAKPCIFQIGIKIQQIRSLGKEQELMLWIFTDLELWQTAQRVQVKRDGEAVHLAARWAGKEAFLKAWCEAISRPSVSVLLVRCNY